MLRCFRDFPERLAQLAFLAPGPEPRAALIFARAAVDLSNRLGETGDWTAVDQIMESVAASRTAFRDHPEIALEQAKAAVNVTSHAGTRAAADGDWTRVEAMLDLLAGLRTAFPDHPEIALEQAKAAFNVTLHAGNSQDWHRVARMEAVLRELDGQREWPDSVKLVVHNRLILASRFKARGDALATREEAEASLESILWVLSHPGEIAGAMIARALQLLKHVRVRFPDHAEAQQVFDRLQSQGLDWDQVPPLAPLP